MPTDDEFDDQRPRRRRDEHDDFDRPPRKKSSNTAIIVIVVILACSLVCCIPIGIGLLLPAVQKTREAANRVKSSNNLKQIGVGMHNFESNYQSLPGNSYGPDGKPFLSWRVHLLPFVEQENLYRQFNLDEPWNGPTNIRLLNQIPSIYVAPNKPSDSMTYYRGFSSPGAVFGMRDGLRPQADLRNGISGLSLTTFKDLKSQTILVVDAGDPIEWTKPDDLEASPGKPMPALGGLDPSQKRMQVLWADGSVTMLRTNLPDATLRALMTHSGQETLTPDWDD